MLWLGIPYPDRSPMVALPAALLGGYLCARRSAR
jgi:hypothetical protein